MLSEDAFLELVGNIVASELPDEQDAFELEGLAFARRAMAGKGMPKLDRDDAADNRGGSGAVETLRFVLMMWGTWKMLLDWHAIVERRGRSGLEREFQEAWKKHLIEAGLAVEVAHKIVTSHAKMFSDRLPPQRG